MCILFNFSSPTRILALQTILKSLQICEASLESTKKEKERERETRVASMAYSFPDVYCWIQNLPPISEWETSTMALNICSSSSSSQPFLNLTLPKNHESPKLSFVIIAELDIPVPLWTSKPFKLSSKTMKLIDEETISNLFVNFIQAILQYGSNKNSPFIRIPKLDSFPNISDVFNCSFFTLSFLVCMYEAPAEIRSRCITIFKDHLTGFQSRQASSSLMKLLGSNLAEQWMRSVNLAITNWIGEIEALDNTFRTPCPLFSVASSTFGLWKVQLYCPVITMDVENSKSHPANEKLQFSLNYHQVESVLQFNYKVILKENWVEIMVNIDNIRCDVTKLVNDYLMRERGAGTSEKHFPSGISLQLTPTLQNQVLSLSVGKSSENPEREIGVDKSIEASFEPPHPLGLKVSAGESTTVSLKPWKFEESVYGYTANLNWFLHDSTDGKEVFSTKPSKCALLNPKSWFKNRYSSAHRPFTREGGVIFAGDEYGERVWWKVDKSAIGKTMEWEIRGWILLTYWPNKHMSLYSETRRMEFREIVHLNVA
ncbi:uncharacterized protein LOC133317231 [Gastrolobium bilobum]|uniref:uncharacterized protein LOC133317231 n=1 Tax=Gastrolobium bilobum TaxID=150636 RepID=UPI002AB2EE5E|nr:uncharacterized protein LOC133317231 [Gastrolobium bilobum]